MKMRLVFALLITVLLPGKLSLAKQPELHSFVKGSFEEIRKTHEGVPTIVHFWGLNCGPCLVELPEWGRILHERHGFKLVVVHADRLPEKLPLLTGTLARAGLTGAENWAFGEPFRSLRSEVDPEWRGEIPYTLLIAKDGTINRVAGFADMANIEEWLDEQASREQRVLVPSKTSKPLKPS